MSEMKAPWLCIKPQCSLTCDMCNHAIRNVEGPRKLIFELLEALATDGHGAPFEEGDCAIVDKARAYLCTPEVAASIADLGRMKVAVDLLTECLGPLEVSAALESEDGGEAIEDLIERVRKFAADAKLIAATLEEPDDTPLETGEGDAR